MKKRSFVSGFVAGAVLFGSVGAMAAGGNMIEVFYGVKNIKIDNVSKTSAQKPFIYEGTTYVPLRFVAENLNQPVKWDGSTQTIYIGETGEETAVYPGKDIKYLNYQEGSSVSKFVESFEIEGEKLVDNLGNEYDKFIWSLIYQEWGHGANTTWNYVEYPLNGQYKEFKAMFGLDERYKNTQSTVTLEISADEKVIYTKELRAGDMPSEIKVDLTNAIKVKFSFSSDANGDVAVGLFNPRFIQ